MELGEKIRRARLAAGLSQRQLAGDEITRNMLSLIENGTAKPSVKTLRYLSGRLEKPLSYFLEDWDAPDPGRGWEALRQAARALEEGRDRYAENLLQEARGDGDDFLRRKLLLSAALPGADIPALCAALPSLDEELLLRALGALESGALDRCRALLDAAQQQEAAQWLLLSGRLEMARGNYAGAKDVLLRAESTSPAAVPLLEICFRELGDYKSAYEYACKRIRKE